jgi:thymidylate synthase (FAD)
MSELKSNAEAVERLKWQKFPVLNDGFVCLVDCMGDDAAVVQAARVSYGEGTRHTSDGETLIRYLMRNRHTTPFEMVELKFLVRVPMDCWRQWIRHRTASVNEYSTRYSVAIDSAQTTDPREWRQQATDNKQGSGEMLPDAAGLLLTLEEQHLQEQARQVYASRLKAGVAREQARKDLPLSTYTEAYWKVDLHNLLHFLALRLDDHAQKEIRLYSQAIVQIVMQLFPAVWRAFEAYRLRSMQLTALDIGVIQRLSVGIRGSGFGTWDEEAFVQCQDPSWVGLVRCRERDECREKLKRLGLL